MNPNHIFEHEQAECEQNEYEQSEYEQSEYKQSEYEQSDYEQSEYEQVCVYPTRCKARPPDPHQAQYMKA